MNKSLKENTTTCMWQEERGKKFYKVQTNDKDIANKIKRRNGFHLCAKAVNANLWIFSCEFTRPDIAKKTLKSITGLKVEYNKNEDIFYSRVNISREEKLVA